MSGGPASLEREVDGLRVETQRVPQEMATAIGSVVTETRSALVEDSQRFERRSTVQVALESFDTSYEEVKARSTVHEARLIELADLEDRRKSSNDLLEQQRRDLKELGSPQDDQTRLRAELVRLYGERSKRLDAQCQEVTLLSDGLLRASMRHGHGLNDVEAKFRSLTAGSGLRGSRIDDLFSGLRRENDPVGTWETVLAEIEALLVTGGDNEWTSERTPTLTRLGLQLSDQKKIQPKLSPDAWLDLALTPVADRPVFEYQTKEGEFMEFELASPGQQATALLRVLLAQTGMPLIIDHPEEDLDTQQDLVGRLSNAKRGRQILFASLNANIVVNGDAELVVVCDYRVAGDQSGGKISNQGAIDVPSIRNDITRVMEGGEKAFRLRKDKYGF